MVPLDGQYRASLGKPVDRDGMDPRLVGRQAARLLADIIEGRTTRGPVLQVPTDLHVRASTTGR